MCSQAVSSVSKVSGLELQKEPPLASSCNTWFLGVTPNRTQTLHLLIVFCFFFFQTVVSIANKCGFFSEKHLKSSRVSGSCSYLPQPLALTWQPWPLSSSCLAPSNGSLLIQAPGSISVRLLVPGAPGRAPPEPGSVPARCLEGSYLRMSGVTRGWWGVT